MTLKTNLTDYLYRSAEAIRRSPFDQLEQAARMLLDARSEGRWIFTAGNGGSAATASHFANDLVKGLSYPDKKRFRAMALPDGVPVLTALANDYDYSVCFSEPLLNYASAGDVLVVFSGSGNSPNVVKAAETARKLGVKVLGFTGRDGGRVAGFCDVNCVAATGSMEEIEDAHLAWGHALVTGMREMILNE